MILVNYGNYDENLIFKTERTEVYTNVRLEQICGEYAVMVTKGLSTPDNKNTKCIFVGDFFTAVDKYNRFHKLDADNETIKVFVEVGDGKVE